MIYLVVLRRSGPLWDATKPLEQQSGWPQHAAFMDELVERRFVILGGPLSDEHRVVLVVEAPGEYDVRDMLSRDPWSDSHLVIDTVDAWTLRLLTPRLR